MRCFVSHMQDIFFLFIFFNTVVKLFGEGNVLSTELPQLVLVQTAEETIPLSSAIEVSNNFPLINVSRFFCTVNGSYKITFDTFTHCTPQILLNSFLMPEILAPWLSANISRLSRREANFRHGKEIHKGGNI